MKRATFFAALPLMAASLVWQAHASDDRQFFDSVEGQWVGPGEIVAGRYKGTKFTCNFTGASPAANPGLSLDGTCRVGVFTQKMSANIERKGKTYRGTFMDGAAGKGLDVVSGSVDEGRVLLTLSRNALNGAMLARLPDQNTMNVTVSVRVDDELVPVIGMSLKRVDDTAVGSVARK